MRGSGRDEEEGRYHMLEHAERFSPTSLSLQDSIVMMSLVLRCWAHWSRAFQEAFSPSLLED